MGMMILILVDLEVVEFVDKSLQIITQIALVRKMYRHLDLELHLAPIIQSHHYLLLLLQLLDRELMIIVLVVVFAVAIQLNLDLLLHLILLLVMTLVKVVLVEGEKHQVEEDEFLIFVGKIEKKKKSKYQKLLRITFIRVIIIYQLEVLFGMV